MAGKAIVVSRAGNEGEGGEQGSELLLSYLMGSSFHHYLRNSYPHFHLLLDEQKIRLVRNAELFRAKDDHTTMHISYNHPTLSILIYGELKARGKLHSKGHYFAADAELLEIHFLKKSLLLMIQRTHLEALLDEYELFYTKKQIIQRILPTESLGFEKKSYKILCQYAQSVSNQTQPPYSLLHEQEPGVYLFYEGTFALISAQGTKILQLVVDLHGEECLWGESPEYKVKPTSLSHKYLWLHRSVLLQVLNAEGLAKMKELHAKRREIRRAMQGRCELALEGSGALLRGTGGKAKKKFSQERIRQFGQMLQRMSQRSFRPRWVQEEEAVRAHRLENMRKNRQYVPQKAKSRYFSTLRDKPFDPHFYHTLHQVEATPYHLKLHLHERSSTQLLFHRRAKTEHTFRQESPQSNQKSLQSKQKQMRKSSHSYYSYNYDRTYSSGMTNLAKMKQYELMKHSSTLSRGEKALSTQQLADALKVSFSELHSTVACSKRERNMDPAQFLQKSEKKKTLLVKKLMDSRGMATWR